MATSITKINKETWALISAASCTFQVVSGHECLVKEAAALPTGEYNYKVASPKEIYNFTQLDGNLYAYCQDGPALIAVDPV